MKWKGADYLIIIRVRVRVLWAGLEVGFGSEGLDLDPDPLIIFWIHIRPTSNWSQKIRPIPLKKGRVRGGFGAGPIGSWTYEDMTIPNCTLVKFIRNERKVRGLSLRGVWVCEKWACNLHTSMNPKISIEFPDECWWILMKNSMGVDDLGWFCVMKVAYEGGIWWMSIFEVLLWFIELNLNLDTDAPHY